MFYCVELEVDRTGRIVLKDVFATSAALAIEVARQLLEEPASALRVWPIKPGQV